MSQCQMLTFHLHLLFSSSFKVVRWHGTVGTTAPLALFVAAEAVAAGVADGQKGSIASAWQSPEHEACGLFSYLL